MPSTVYPYISVIIPTYNRPTALAGCLHALAAQEYPRDRFEVIVVNDGGTESPNQVVHFYRNTLTCRVVHQANRGPAAARNHGAKVAAGQLLAFTDDDCAPAPDWLTCLSERFLQSGEIAVGGETRNALTGNLYSVASQVLVSYLVDYYSGAPRRIRFFPSSNVAFPAGRFRSIGGFSSAYPRAAGEDRELCDRWQHEGNRIVYAPEAVVYHSHRLGAGTFLRQHFQYGCGAFHYHQHRARHRGQSLRIEPPVFYFRLFAYPFRKLFWGQALGVVPLLVAAQAANAAGFFWQRAKGVPACEPDTVRSGPDMTRGAQ
jgi:glycosyltransferase involved in cell wall biosynthesis